MSPDRIVGIRQRLRLPQSYLAALLGVHEMTVLRWERGRLKPNYFQRCLLICFGAALRRDPFIGLVVRALIEQRVIAYALYHLFRTAFEPLP